MRNNLYNCLSMSPRKSSLQLGVKVEVEVEVGVEVNVDADAGVELTSQTKLSGRSREVPT